MTRNRLFPALACAMLAAGSARAEEFRGTTTISGTEGSVVRIELSATASLSFDPLVDIEGAGDFIGFALSPDPVVLDSFPDSPPRPRAGIILVGGLTNGEIPYTNYVGTPTLDAGDYLLYLLADGSMTRVTLHMPELSGSVEIPVVHLVAYDARFLPSIVTADGAQVIYSAGTSGELVAPGLALKMLWVTGAEVIEDFYAGNSGVYGTCLYDRERGEDPPDEAIAYLPGCPWREQSQYLLFANVVQTPGFAGVVHALLNHLRAGLWGQGVWYVTPSLVEDSGGVAFWLSLDSPPPDPTISVEQTTWTRMKERYRRTR